MLIHIQSYPTYYIKKYALITLTSCLSNRMFEDALYARKIVEYIKETATNHYISRLVSSYIMNRRPM